MYIDWIDWFARGRSKAIINHVLFRHELTIDPQVMLLDAFSALLASLDKCLLVQSREEIG